MIFEIPHLNLYQLCHPWHWLTYGQNATALGILFATSVNVFSVFVLTRTLRSINRQALAADRQAQAAEAQAVAANALKAVSEAQTAASERAAKMAEDANILAGKQMLAQMLPLLVLQREDMTVIGSKDFISYLVQNQGSGTAQHVAWWYGRLSQQPRFDGQISSSLIGAGYSAKVELNWERIQREWLTIAYDSMDGRGFITSVAVENGRLMQVQVDRSQSITALGLVPSPSSA
jgi:hypothetical protein